MTRCSGAVVAAALAFAIGSAAPARATTFDHITVEQLTQRSELVLHGRVLETRVYPAGPNRLPGIHTEVVLAVDEALKGAPDSVVRFWVHGGRIGDRMRVVHGQATFEAGEEVVVFLFRNEAGALWPTGMGRGKWSVRQTPSGQTTTPATGLEAEGSASPAVPLRQLMGEVRRVAGT